MEKIKNLTDLKQIKSRIIKKTKTGKKLITICGGTGCHASGCNKVISAFRREIKKNKLEKKVEIKITGCHGFCERGPIVVIHPEGIFYQKVQSQDIKNILSETVIEGKIIDRLLYIDPNTGKSITNVNDIPFYKKQCRNLLEKNVLVDPTKIEDYMAIGGYSAFCRVLKTMTPEDVIDVIKEEGYL